MYHGAGCTTKAGAAGDVLAGEIFDVAFDRVLIRQAVARLRVEIQRQLPFGVERGGLGSELARFRAHALVAAADECEAIGGKAIQHSRAAPEGTAFASRSTPPGDSLIGAPNR